MNEENIQGQQNDKPVYIEYVDSVRGIAVLWVMFFHYLNTRYKEHSMAKLASFFFNGETAIFLFVLSGFVLSYKYIVLGQPLDIRRFYVQRFIRFWPAFFVAVLINALYQYRNDLSAGNLVNQFIFDKGKFWEEALLIRFNPGFESIPQYYVPGWALVVILSMSFLMPFMVVLALKDTRYILWLLLAFVLVGNNMGPKYIYHVHFALGILVSCWFVAINKGALKRSKWYKYRYLILTIAIILFSCRQLGRINKIHFFSAGYRHWVLDYFGLGFSFYSAIASFIFLVAIINSGRTKKFLDNRSLRFIGKISYCIYLMHWVVVLAIFDHWTAIAAFFPNTITAVITMMIVCTAVAMLLATILHYTVELPSIRFSKRISKKLRPSLVIKKDG